MYGTEQKRFPQTGAQKLCVHNKLLFADVCFVLIEVGASVRKEMFRREVRHLWERGSRVLFGCSQNLDMSTISLTWCSSTSHPASFSFLFLLIALQNKTVPICALISFLSFVSSFSYKEVQLCIVCFGHLLPLRSERCGLLSACLNRSEAAICFSIHAVKESIYLLDMADMKKVILDFFFVVLLVSSSFSFVILYRCISKTQTTTKMFIFFAVHFRK